MNVLPRCTKHVAHRVVHRVWPCVCAQAPKVIFGASARRKSTNVLHFGASPLQKSMNVLHFGASPLQKSMNVLHFGVSEFQKNKYACSTLRPTITSEKV